MLQSLHVKNLALIDELDVDFSEGLNILSGETGAGKSIILGSINICLGGKVPKEMLKEDSTSSFVEMIFSVDTDYEKEKLKELDIIPEDDQIIISRRINAGRSTLKVNSETVTSSVVRDLAAAFINVHGQNESQILQNTRNHMNILDSYGGEELLSIKRDMAIKYASYKESYDELIRLSSDSSDRNREISFLEFEINEIKEAQLKENEDVELEEEYKRLKNWQKIFEGVTAAEEQTAGGYDNASEKISYALKELSPVCEYDEQVASFYNTLLDVDSILSDFNREIASFLSSNEFDQERFVEIERRLDTINHLKSKYGNSIDKILDSCAEKEKRLYELNNFEEALSKAKSDCDKNRKIMKKCAENLHEIRSAFALKFEKNLVEILKDLNFNSVQFKAEVKSSEEFTALGCDSVEFFISTNVGESIKPLNKVASGGELSRVMLAIKTLNANKDDISTMIFDEIDAGISGRTAQMISEKLAYLSREHQIICITHLPQIASMADSHFLIEKNVENGHTVSRIKLLNEDESVSELARMLGGTLITENVVNNAKEMKSLAEEFKSRS